MIGLKRIQVRGSLTNFVRNWLPAKILRRFCGFCKLKADNFHSSCIDFKHRIRRYSTSSGTVYCSICSPQIYVSQQLCARGGNFVIGLININKYTSASENVHLCLRKNRRLGHISVATGRIPSLFCALNLYQV